MPLLNQIESKGEHFLVARTCEEVDMADAEVSRDNVLEEAVDPSCDLASELTLVLEVGASSDIT